MSTTTTIYGSVDNLGYLYCVPCRSIMDESDDNLVWGLPHSAEKCDQCGAPLSQDSLLGSERGKK